LGEKIEKIAWATDRKERDRDLIYEWWKGNRRGKQQENVVYGAGWFVKRDGLKELWFAVKRGKGKKEYLRYSEKINVGKDCRKKNGKFYERQGRSYKWEIKRRLIPLKSREKETWRGEKGPENKGEGQRRIRAPVQDQEGREIKNRCRGADSDFGGGKRRWRGLVLNGRCQQPGQGSLPKKKKVFRN